MKNAIRREICGVKMVVESIHRWYGYMERMENERMVKKAYMRTF